MELYKLNTINKVLLTGLGWVAVGLIGYLSTLIHSNNLVIDMWIFFSNFVIVIGYFTAIIITWVNPIYR